MPDVYTAGNMPLQPGSMYYWSGSAWLPWTGAVALSAAPPTDPGQSLADGQLPDTTGDLYTVPAATWTDVQFVWLFNTNTTAETVQLALQRSGGTSRLVWQQVLAAGDSFVLAIGPLAAGDKLRGATTTANKVNYEVLGQEHPL